MKVLPLEEHSVDALAGMLARAFDVDAAYRYLFPVDAERPSGLADFFARNLRTHLPHRCTYVACSASGELLATVTLRPPEGISISALTMVRRGLLPFALAHGRSAVRRLFWLKATYDALEQRATQSAPHWYVHMMAVRPESQGRGLGSELLDHVLERARASVHPTVLTTHLSRNVVFYQRAGFELLEESLLSPPGDRPYTVWSLRRAAG